MKWIALIASTLVLAGCAAAGDFPSLAKRPFEKTPEIAKPVDPPAAAPSNPELLARVATHLAAARASQAPFDLQMSKSRAQVAVASGAGEGSERWIEGQIGASRLEPLLAPASNAAAAIADEYRALMLTPLPTDLPVVEAAYVEATAIAERQAQASAALTAQLNR